MNQLLSADEQSIKLTPKPPRLYFEQLSPPRQCQTWSRPLPPTYACLKVFQFDIWKRLEAKDYRKIDFWLSLTWNSQVVRWWWFQCLHPPPLPPQLTQARGLFRLSSGFHFLCLGILCSGWSLSWWSEHYIISRPSSEKTSLGKRKVFLRNCPDGGGDFLAPFQAVHFWSIKWVYFFPKCQ